MESFNFVIFGITSNLAQLKIIPALYDLEAKGSLDKDTEIVGIGRKELNIAEYVRQVLHSTNRHHTHSIDPKIEKRLVGRIKYLRENFEDGDGNLYSVLKSIQGNTLYYLATYPNLYSKIFETLKKHDLNKSKNGWVRIMIEKPIGNSLKTSQKLDNLLNKYFNESQIYRVDHYLGKNSLRKIFTCEFNPQRIQKIEISISEDFGIGKRGIYFDATGALIDMGQNHILQMLTAVIADNPSRKERERILNSLKADPDNAIFGQYDGYLSEPDVKSNSKTETFFALKAGVDINGWSEIPVYLWSGKKLNTTLSKIVLSMRNESRQELIISPLKIDEKLDPYERLLTEAVKGDQTFFNSRTEIEASWKFIDYYEEKKRNLFVYKPGSSLADRMSAKFSA